MEGQINIKVKPGAGGRRTAREKRNSRIKRTTKREEEGKREGVRVGTVIYQAQIGISMVACTERAKYRPALFQLSPPPFGSLILYFPNRGVLFTEEALSFFNEIISGR